MESPPLEEISKECWKAKKRIYKAASRGDVTKVRQLQRALQEFVLKAALVTTKNALICHS
jgi:hypothetical protein